MTSSRFIILCLVGMVFTGCNSVNVETTYRNPEVVLFHSNKLLIVGMTSDAAIRQAYESEMQEIFNKAGVETFRSIDLFDVAFTSAEQSGQDLDRVEQQLIDKDFDAILFTKVIGSETRTTLRRKVQQLGTTYDQFQDDYLLHQGLYYDRNYYEALTDYYTETSLYCICEGKERNLIWRSVVHIADPKDPERAMNDFIKLLQREMEKHQLILGTGVF